MSSFNQSFNQPVQDTTLAQHPETITSCALTWERFPLIQEQAGSPSLSVRNLRSAITSMEDFETLLDRLDEPAFIQHFLKTFLASNTTCSDLKCDSVEKDRKLTEFLCLSASTEKERTKLRSGDAKAQAVLKKIIDAGYHPEWIDLTQRICKQAQLPTDVLTTAYNVIRSTHIYSQTPRAVHSLLELHCDATINELARTRFSLEPVLCFTERNQCPGFLHEWTLKTFPEPDSKTNLKSFWIWMDAPFGMLLLKDGLPQAICSFSINHKEQALHIEQIQGLSAVESERNGNGTSSPTLFPPKLYGVSLRHLFFSLVEELTNCCDLKKIIVTGQANNIWTRPNKWKKIPGLKKTAAKALYDDIANERCYTKRPDGNWEYLL